MKRISRTHKKYVRPQYFYRASARTIELAELDIDIPFLSVCLSNAGILSKRLYETVKLNLPTGRAISLVFKPIRHYRVLWVTPSTGTFGTPWDGGIGTICDFRP